MQEHLPTYTYDSFGNLTASTGSLTNPFQYTARESDPETGLYYYRARYYDPSAGRFFSEDPIGFSGGINFYEYAGNAPTMLVDRTGFQKSSWASQLDDLLDWAGGTWVPSGSYHSNDPVTRDLSKSPAMQEIRDKSKAGCEPGLYCGEFHFGQIFTTANLVIQTVGSSVHIFRSMRTGISKWTHSTNGASNRCRRFREPSSQSFTLGHAFS